MSGGVAGPPAPPSVELVAESPDAADVLELFDLADAYGLSLYPAESYHALDLAEFSRPEVTLLVARVDGRALGMAALVLTEPDPVPRCAEVKRMFVRPEARGRGLARRLLSALETRASGAGVSVIRLETGPPQVEAIALYERAGYARIPNFGPYVGDPMSVCFEKHLP